jgi:hypothetical protein
MDECTCITCSGCAGLGFVMVSTGWYPEDEPESCQECRGSGISEECPECLLMDEMAEETWRP